MTDVIIIDVLLTFMRIALPVVGVLSLVLCLRPKLFMNLEKSLSKELGNAKVAQKTIKLLETENLILHNALQKNNRLVGLLCLILTMVCISRIYF